MTSRLDDLYSMRERIDTQIRHEVRRLEEYAVIERTRANDVLDRAGWAACGTEGGYYRHRRTLKEPACGPCKQSHSDAEKDRAARRRIRQEMAA